MRSDSTMFESPMVDARELTDLKTSSRTVQTIFKNHTKNIRILTPTKPAFEYQPGKLLVFEVGNYDDYWNVEASQLILTIKITVDNTVATDTANPKVWLGECWMNFSVAHIFDLYRLENGGTRVQNLDHYGDYTHSQTMGRAQANADYLYTGVYTGPSADDPTSIVGFTTSESIEKKGKKPNLICASNFTLVPEASTNVSTIKTFAYPWHNILENAGYFPIGDMNMPLRHTFRLSQPNDFMWDINMGVETMVGNARPTRSVGRTTNRRFVITEARMLLYTLKVSWGGVLNAEDFTFHTVAVNITKRSLPDAKMTRRYVIDETYSSSKQKKTMVIPKKGQALGIIASTRPRYQIELASIPFTAGLREAETQTEYHYEISGVVFPQDLPVHHPSDVYYHLMNFYHEQDVTGIYSDPFYSYCEDFQVVTKKLKQGWALAASFDRMAMTSKVISGIDVETASVVLTVKDDSTNQCTYTDFSAVYDTAASHNGYHMNDGVGYEVERMIESYYDVILTVTGGQLVLTD